MTPYEPLDRRPIASRELGVFRRLADGLVRLRVSANFISVAGMLAAIAGGTALAMTPHLPKAERVLWIVAAACAQLRLIANLLDGMVAIGSGSASRVGELYNEVPDRVSDTALLAGLGWAVGGVPLLGLGAALAAMFTAYVRTTVKAAGAPMSFIGPMAKQHRMFILTLVSLYMGAAPLEWRLEWGLPAAALSVIIAGSLVTALRRLARGARTLREAAP